MSENTNEKMSENANDTHETNDENDKSSNFEIIKISQDDDATRIDKIIKYKYPSSTKILIQKLCRKGAIRLNGKRCKAEDRVEQNDELKVPLSIISAEKAGQINDLHSNEKVKAFKSWVIYEDDDCFVINKPSGLSAQGGSGLVDHLDLYLDALFDNKITKQRPRLTHRLDRDTSGVLLIAKTRKAAQFFTENFKKRDMDKTYIAVCYRAPTKNEDKISNFIKKIQIDGEDRMVKAKHGKEGAQHAVTYYKVLERLGEKFSLIELKPETGRTHQLRVHLQQLGHPILGDAKYFNIENWSLPSGIQNKLHLHSKSLEFLTPNGKKKVVTAPIPPHIHQTFKVLGFDF